MSHYFYVSDLINLTGPNASRALIVVLLAAGLLWAISAHNSHAHKLAVPVFISAAAAAIVLALVAAIATWM
jgi:hypothetical protein